MRPAAPTRPLPTIGLVSAPPEPAIHIRLSEQVGGAPRSRPLRGQAEEARLENESDRLVLYVSLASVDPRPGWAGAVDHGLRYRRAGAAAARFLSGPHRGSAEGLPSADSVVALDDSEIPAGSLADFLLGYLLGARRQDEQAAKPAATAPNLLVVSQHSSAALGAGGDSDASSSDSSQSADIVAWALQLAEVTALARDLAGAPSNLKSPQWLAETAAEILGSAGMRTEILAGDQLEAEGFGGVLAVGAGSSRSPRVLVARRAGTGARVLLVGKGITFDTGGISIKPAENMHLMRTDMAGSAAVIAAAAAWCKQQRCAAADDLDLTVVIPMAENMPSGSAYRPGDVITHVGGATSEITNTDAEGRLVLADALAYGTALCQPDIVVDIATLTGAMKIALGMRTGAVLSTDDDLAQRISYAGARCGERWWRLPLLEDHRSAVQSDIADRTHTPAGPGTITAGLFLEGFVDGRPWAHLDIAGPARSPVDIDEVVPVATGFGTRTLLLLLRDLEDRPRE